ncbi:MAG: S-layer homology domain-containing protein [Anaerolineales bacterium]|nr:S-layer homology domain-containing protein [Anaerolineales bacterium]
MKGIHGSSYTPPAVNGNTGFSDVAADYWAAAWIKQLAAEGITSGCGGGNYCPDNVVTRAQMSVFLLKAKNGSSYSPPAVGVSTGFNDVATDACAAAFIKQLAAEGITSGCGNSNYCPDDSVTRAQMAVFQDDFLSASCSEISGNLRGVEDEFLVLRTFCSKESPETSMTNYLLFLFTGSTFVLLQIS